MARNSAWASWRIGAGAATAIARAVSAQPGNVILGDASWHWEVSADGGATWHGGGLEVDRSQASVEVRAVCTFEQRSPRWYFGYTFFDGVVSGVGPDDRAEEFRWGYTPNTSRPVAQRFGDVLKIDLGGVDTLPPGLGPSWLSVGQGPPTQPIVRDFRNPFLIMQYRLALDGTPGAREIGAVFWDRTPSDVTTGFYLRVYDSDNPFVQYFQTLHEARATVRVIPAPDVAAVVGVAMVMVQRRRRSRIMGCS